MERSTTRTSIDGRSLTGTIAGIALTGAVAIAAAILFTTTARAEPLAGRAAQTSAALATEPRLAALGYLAQGSANGSGSDASAAQTALVAFQKWQGLPPTGRADGVTLTALAHADRPHAIGANRSGRSLEVLLDRQVMLAIANGRVVRTIDVSTGKPSTPTPAGSFHVYAKFSRWWSQPFGEWLLWAAPFDRGIAVHEFPSVPAYAASHGCVRVTSLDARWVYDFVSVGTTVDVIAHSR